MRAESSGDRVVASKVGLEGRSLEIDLYEIEASLAAACEEAVEEDGL
jgi:hypothetical protein